jgi:opacity protein-like surface antigen
MRTKRVIWMAVHLARRETIKQKSMKSLKLLTTTTLLAAAFLARADGRECNPLQGFYANADVGVNIMTGTTFTAGGVSGKLSTDVGERVNAAVGYMVPIAKNTGVGLEFELGGIINSLNKVSGNGGTADLNGYYYQMPFLVNGVVVCRAVPKWSFFAGAGGGGVYSRIHVHEVNGFNVDSNGDETDGAFQLMGGVTYEVIKNADVGLAYKYLAVFVEGTDHVNNHAVLGTFTWHF